MKLVILFFKLVMPGMILFSFLACNGILEGIYDDPPAKEFGFIETNEANNSGVVHINATKYDQWVYIDFHSQQIDSVKISENMEEPENWDIAVHRYDAKTNSGTVLETEYSGLLMLRSSGKVPEGNYITDEWTTNKIIVDMSGMAEGVLKYAESYYNRELSKWLFVDTSRMPPDYNPSNRVYVIKLKDNTIAAVRLRNFMNGRGVKGYMTIEYIYPFKV